MTSKRKHEGYLLIDNSFGPGISEADLARLPRKGPVPAVPEGSKFEAPTITCSHCHTVVVINSLRTRARAYCVKCDHYICDVCGVVSAQTKECRPLKAVLDEQQEQNFLRQQAGLPVDSEIIIKT